MKVICLNFVCHSRLCHSFQDDFLRSQQKGERNLPEKEDLKIVFFGICPHPSLSCPFFFYFKPEFWFRFGQQITLQLHRFFFSPLDVFFKIFIEHAISKAVDSSELRPLHGPCHREHETSRRDAV